ncbi:hypothetical protein E3P99_02924 [Wallemia hederae]|uniref:L-arabinitol 4-dehydrogenase n=1 Tax=Wallemia hederae TaxID=1540922 RepID=A0A4T0FIA8_9BASI|nr:hypothetical protein E3P99_02924 [Wallemia hederae]
MSDRTLYDPSRITNHPDFKLLPQGDKPDKDRRDLNYSLMYDADHVNKYCVRPRLDPAPGQVEVHVKATGICGSRIRSDVHFATHGNIGDMKVTQPCSCGHESAGVVTRIGEGVENFSIGEKVALENGIGCGQCIPCKKGVYNSCEIDCFFSTPPFHGTMTRYHLHPAEWLHKLPDSVSYEEGALCEPLTVSMAAVARSGLRLGDVCLVAGAGPIGLVTLLSVRAAGGIPIITDLSQGRLDFAKKLVPNARTVLIEKGVSQQDVAQKIKAAAGNPITVAIECTGVESSIGSTIYSMAFGGKVFVTGVGKEIQSYPMMHCSANEISLDFQYRYANQYPRSIRLVAEGYIDLKPLVTHRFDLEDAMDAMNTAADPRSGAIKVQVLDN